ncbi:putative secreted protein (Por secretion system target) [Chryseobacterium sp. 52]|uniref:zinc-dependent metalloprotease n=1 Tax=Chryseobacterium sp. 52 TaxID=2035213 RepID=UPI000C186BDA|nr:zinc-dependent metalloprotease [Chryseobacterium sp. 52]PIF46202.1 putative secreted protein (Por secretion system target) [Chryseobacterium sp. 52]
MKNYFLSAKKLLIVCLLLFLNATPISFAQQTVFSLSNQSYNNLNPTQKSTYDKIKQQGIYNDIQFINYNIDAINDPNGILKLSLNNFLDSFQFKSTRVQYTDPKEFNWTGEFHSNDVEEEENFAKLSFLSHSSGRIIGSIQTNTKNYQIYDLTGGTLVLAEYNLSQTSGSQCASKDTPDPSPPPASSDCGSNKTNILIIYTPGAAANEPDLHGKALLCINELNRIWLPNSNIANYAHLAGVATVNSLEENELSFYPAENRISWDLQNFSTSIIVQNLRNQYKADIVVFLTKAVYKDTNAEKEYLGLATVGANVNNAFSLVTNVNATSGRHVFAHEVNHLYGARHWEDNTPGYAHGHTFLTGNILFIGHKRYTLMTNKAKYNNLEHISNPEVNFLNRPTGIYNTNDNARKIREFINPIASFYSDQVPFTPGIIINGPSLCQQNGTATISIPQECRGPFTYQWSYSDNGVNWVLVPNGNTAIINTFVPLPLYSTINGTFNSRMYRVKVTRFNGDIAYATNTAFYNCPSFKKFSKVSEDAVITNEKLIIAPNPAKDNIEIQTTLSEKETVSIRLLDLSGKVILEKSENFDKGRQNIKFNLEKITQGTYIIEVKSNGKITSQKLIISK